MEMSPNAERERKKKGVGVPLGINPKRINTYILCVCIHIYIYVQGLVFDIWHAVWGSSVTHVSDFGGKKKLSISVLFFCFHSLFLGNFLFCLFCFFLFSLSLLKGNSLVAAVEESWRASLGRFQTGISHRIKKTKSDLSSNSTERDK